jgi:hypothetical protein
MQSSPPEYAREKLADWQRDQMLLGVFLAVGGGTYCSMRVRLKSIAKHMMALQGECGKIALWINDARLEYGPVDLFLSPTPPPKQVTGVSIHLKKGGWAFVFELSERERSLFGLDNELKPIALESGDEEEEETAGAVAQ